MVQSVGDVVLDKLGIAFGFSVILGIPATWGWSMLVHWGVEKKFSKPAFRLKWMPALVGIFERGLITAFVIWIPAAVGPFMGTWIMAKAVGGWALVTTGEDHKRALYFAGLLGSLFSMAWAIGAGVWAVLCK